MSVIDEIAAERERQKSEECWSEKHDDEHTSRELAYAAACYCIGDDADQMETIQGDSLWPWCDGFNPKDERRNLIRAAALIVAEIERLDRAAPQESVPGECQDCVGPGVKVCPDCSRCVEHCEHMPACLPGCAFSGPHTGLCMVNHPPESGKGEA